MKFLRRRSQRQLHRERGAAVRLALHGQRAAVALDDVVADVEPEPGPSGLGGEERLEHGLQVLRRDPAPWSSTRTTTRQAERAPALVGSRRAQADASIAHLTRARRRGLGGVLDQVDEHLLDLVGVVRHGRRARRDLDADVDAALGEPAPRAHWTARAHRGPRAAPARACRPRGWVMSNRSWTMRSRRRISLRMKSRFSRCGPSPPSDRAPGTGRRRRSRSADCGSRARRSR